MQTDETRKINLASALVVVGLCASESESKRLIRGGGVYVNREKAAENGYVRAGDLISAGKKHHATLAFAAPPAVEREGEQPTLADIEHRSLRLQGESANAHGLTGGEPVSEWIAGRMKDAADRALAPSTPTLHPSDREEGLREAAQAVVDNATRSYRSRGKDRYIEDESGELMMLVPHEDWYRLEHSLAGILALSGSLAPEGGRVMPGRFEINTILAKHFSPFIDDFAERVRVGNLACTEILATLRPSTEKGETK